MQICTREKNRALAEIYTYILIVYESYKGGNISKTEFEKLKDSYLYDRKILDEYADYLITAPQELKFADPNKTALDVLNNLIDEGAVTLYEYNTLKQRHLLF